METELMDIPVQTWDGQYVRLGELAGRRHLLIVNVASQCGFTPQYAGLEKLHREMGDRLTVVGFPCNQFGGQEPGEEKEIRQFCTARFGVTFPLMAKVEVNGPGTHPVYRVLKRSKRGLLGREGVAWNFTKFLVSPRGKVLRRYGPAVSPERIGKDLAGI